MVTYFNQNKMTRIIPITALLIAICSFPAFTQIIPVGQGSYTTQLPPGAVGPSLARYSENDAFRPATPLVSSLFDQPVQTNDFWSGILYPYFDDPHSSPIFAHPLVAKATGEGLEFGFTDQHVFAFQDYKFPYVPHLLVGVEGLNAPSTKVDGYGDWTVTASWESQEKVLRSTIGHGLPYIYFYVEGANVVINPKIDAQVWHQQGEVLGITIQGKHYGIFAPSGSQWQGTGPWTSSLNAKGFVSVALLPDNRAQTLELFRSHAYAFVVDSRVSWSYTEHDATLLSDYSYETVLMDSADGNSSETMSALYRHQWQHAINPMTEYEYLTPRGIMKLHEGNTFSTRLKFGGVLPSLPDEGDYNPSQLAELLASTAQEDWQYQNTYRNGKEMGRFANLAHIADQLGATSARDLIIEKLKTRLESWFTATGTQQYVYNDQWDVLTGYPSGFGADDQINDHHFHAAYAIIASATVAMYDSAWASQENWGGMVNLLIKDANNWDRNDEMFPFLRSHDAYAGHSWAAGHAAFGDGNNQESSSESMNFASSLVLWGEVTGQVEIRDLGIFLHATETTAIENYWFDVDDEVFPEDYGKVAIAIVWGGLGAHATWFGFDPEFVHGINMLPITAGSLYLGRHPNYVLTNYNEVVSERNSQPTKWKDLLWKYLSLSDPDLALSYYLNDPTYYLNQNDRDESFDGASRAHTMHWLYNLKKMGHVDTTTQADVPTYAVFEDASGEKTYVAYNAQGVEKTVRFTDGFEMQVPPRSLNSVSTRTENPDAPIVLLLAENTRGKSPLRVNFSASQSFDPNDRDLRFRWDFGDLGSGTNPDTSVTFTELGSQWVYLEVSNDLDITILDSVEITVLGNGTPFGGSPVRLPGTFEAEDYDVGGEGLAYHDVDANNIGLAFRPNEGVDLIAANDGGFAVYWIVAGEWIEYTVEVQEAGSFNFDVSVATVPGFGNFRMLIDNQDVSGRKNVTGTGSFENWTPLRVPNVEIGEGTHIVRFEFDSDTDKTGWLFSMNKVVVSRTSSVNNELAAEGPREFDLAQNYPNPFNPITQINYSIPKAAEIQLIVFDTMGRIVATLVDESKASGTYSVPFDASGLASGIYFYRMQAGSYSKIMKLTVLK